MRVGRGGVGRRKGASPAAFGGVCNLAAGGVASLRGITSVFGLGGVGSRTPVNLDFSFCSAIVSNRMSM